MRVWHHLLGIVPQMVLVILIGRKMYKDLPFCMFVQTYTYIIFNKMMSIEYSMWFMVFLSLVFASNKLY